MASPTPSQEACWYDGTDTTAGIWSNDDDTFRSRCHCGTVTCESGTMEQAAAALDAHRAEVA